MPHHTGMKRKYGSYRPQAHKGRRRSTYRRAPGRVVPGFTRVSGFYGRYPVTARSGAGELKFHDVDMDDAVVAATGTVVPTVNIIPQGVTEITRVGRKCTIKNILWRYTYSLPEIDAQGTPASGDVLRVIMFLDKQCNGATATTTGILESANLRSFNNLANSGRFKILYDKKHTINYSNLASDGAGVVSSGSVVRYNEFYKKCNIPIEFDSTTGALTEIRSNNIGTLLLSNSGNAGFVSKIRLRFSDGS